MSLLKFLKVPVLLGRWMNRAAGVTAINNSFLPTTSQQLRYKATYRTNCKYQQPKCGDRFKKKPCDPKQHKKKYEKVVPDPIPPQKRSIKIKRPEICCGDPCSDFYPRFDKLYYKRTDKLYRVYPQTWAECPEVVIKPKVLCCLDKIKYPKLEKRSRKAKQSACKPLCVRMGTKCGHISMPGCRKGRMPPDCHIFKHHAHCDKRKAPYPAYSECTRKPMRRGYPIECRCLLTPAMCEVWRHYYKMTRAKKIGVC